MKLRIRTVVASLVAALAVAAFAQGARVVINGRPAAHAALVHNGETYVSVSDLKAAGAQVTVTGGQTAIRFRSDVGGANQIAGVEGTRGEWLFNGIWRVRVSEVAAAVRPFSDGTPGWTVAIEIRNGADKEVSLFTTGMQPPTLALANGTILKVDEGDWQTISFRNLLPGASVSHSLKFWFPSGTSRADVKKAVRLVMPVDLKSGLLRDSGLHYNGASPAFRVTL